MNIMITVVTIIVPSVLVWFVIGFCVLMPRMDKILKLSWNKDKLEARYDIFELLCWPYVLYKIKRGQNEGTQKSNN